MSLPLKPSNVILELLAPFVSTALLQLLHIGLLVSVGFPCSFASYPKYFQIALLLCSLSTKAGCGGAALAIFIFTSLLLFNQSEWDETRDRHCGHVWCLSTRLWREVKVTARLGSEYRYFGKLVLVPFRYFSIDIYRNIDIFDNTKTHTQCSQHRITQITSSNRLNQHDSQKQGCYFHLHMTKSYTQCVHTHTACAHAHKHTTYTPPPLSWH